MTVVAAAAAVIPFSRLLPISPPPPSLSLGSRHRPFRLQSPSLSISLARRFPRLSSSSQETNTSGSSETLENQEQQEEEKVKETETGEGSSSSSSSSPSAVAKEIKDMLAERKKKTEEEPSGLLGGVAEEVREIEWPAFSKVVGTTGVVLAVIAGSSVALLTVNAVLAELSDRFFAGRGLQDFF